MEESECKYVIEKGTLCRGWISNSYAQIEFLLGDLIVRCRQFPSYDAHTATVSHSAAKRASKVRRMLEIDGPLKQFESDLNNVLNNFEKNHDLRNLLAHGFCTFLHTPDGDSGFMFRKFDRPLEDEGADHVLTQELFRLVDLEYHRAQLVAQAQHALNIFQAIHEALGWGEIT